MEIIRGDIIALRPATMDDKRNIFDWLAHSDLTNKLLGPPDYPDNPVPTWDEFANDYNPHFFDDIDPDQGRSFIIEYNNEAVGHINYNEIHRAANWVELDTWLANSQYTRKGYGPDAINTLCYYLAKHLNCSNFILAPSSRNKNAIRAYEKCGFSRTNKIPDNFVPDYYDTVVMIKIIPSHEV